MKYNIWDKFHAKGKGTRYPNEDIIRFVAQNFYTAPDRKKIKILELGCGIGSNIWFLAREGFDSYGIDISEIAVDGAQTNLKKENLPADLRVGNIAEMNYPENYFDAVIDGVAIGSNTLEDIKRIIGKSYRVLKPNGKFFSLMFSTDTYYFNKNKEIEKNTTRLLYRGGSLHFFKKSEINNLLRNAGFINIEIEYTTRSTNNQKDIIKLWLTTAKK